MSQADDLRAVDSMISLLETDDQSGDLGYEDRQDLEGLRGLHRALFLKVHCERFIL